MNIRKKGILKEGLKYISQMFEEEQQKEIQIGLPTDVKHVAHIGWDGPSTNAPSWMNEFKSAPLDVTGSDSLNRHDDISQGKGNAANSSSAREIPALPKATRVRHPSMDSVASADESPPGSPSSTARSTKKKEKDSTKSSGSARRRKDKPKSNKGESAGGEEGNGPFILPNIPKKISRRKKPKDSEGSGKSASTKQSKRGSRGGSLIGLEDGPVRLNGPGTSLQEE